MASFIWPSQASGTVTSIALTAPASILSVSGSPITSSGTLGLSLVTQSANLVWAGPTTGAAANPTFRSLVTADLPAGTGTVTSITLTVPSFLSVSPSTITTSGTFAISLSGTALPVTSGGTGVTSLGNFTDAGTDGIVVTGGTGSVITSVSIAQHVADTTHNGYLSSTDWNTFNNKGSVSSVSMTVPSFLSVSGSPVTGTGTLAVSLSGTALPIANGGTGQTGIITFPTADTIPAWDDNANFSANAFIQEATSTATAGGTTTMTIASTGTQIWTGSSNQTVKLPTTGIIIGAQYLFLNRSTGTVTVQSSNGSTIQAMAASTWAIFTAFISTPVSSGDWIPTYALSSSVGTVTSVGASGPSGIATWSSAITGSGTLTQTLSNQSANTFLAGPTTGGATTPAFRVLATSDFVAPTTQSFTSGSSQTYTLPTSPRKPLYIRVRMVGGGGGGSGGSSGGTVGNGTATTFGTSLLTANGGTGGLSTGGGAGGTASGGTISNTGAMGSSGSALVNAGGSTGASTPFGGGAGGGAGGANAGSNGVANTGVGGGGGGSGVSDFPGGGGGAGGYVETIITSPSSTYAYTVGTGGAGGTAGTSGGAGGNGASGFIIVDEFYQ